jgi:hypothetical protein
MKFRNLLLRLDLDLTGTITLNHSATIFKKRTHCFEKYNPCMTSFCSYTFDYDRRRVCTLNHVIGRHLLTFLYGTDAINFVEAVNDSEHASIYLPHRLFGCYLDGGDIDEDKLVSVTNRYSTKIQRSIRLFVNTCFSVDGSRKLAKLYKTPLFECYSRLLPLNTVTYSADFGLHSYLSYSRTIGSSRILNDHENKLFKCKY